MSDSQALSHLHKRLHKRWLVGVLLLVLAFVLIGNRWVSQTNLVPELVDFVRELPFVGPDRIAALENTYYDAQDAWTVFIYNHTHAPVVISNLSESQGTATSVVTPTATVALTLTPTPTSTATLTPMAALTTPLTALMTTTVSSATPTRPLSSPTPTTVQATLTPLPPIPTTAINRTGVAHPNLPAPIPPLILSNPQPGEGIWSSNPTPLGNTPRPPLLHTFYRADPTRPYAQVDLVWIDTGQTQLKLVPGTTEPRAIDGTRGAGVIPPDVQSSGKLLAAWNGGFLTINGAYGMMVDRHVILPARDGLAALAQYADGHMQIGVWGQDIQLTPDLVSFRQNGPILIDHGVVNQNGLLAWGASVSGGTHVWRSGIGLTADGALIYAAGNWLDAQTLGQALQRAGAVEAMELDVNAWHVFFFTYAPTLQGPVATKLDAAMPGPSSLYLTPYNRDFMYLTLNP